MLDSTIYSKAPDCGIFRLSFRGQKVGLLRQMDDAPVEAGVDVELVAISSGCASRHDLEDTFDEKLDWTTSYLARLDARHRKLKELGRYAGDESLIQDAPKWHEKEYYHPSDFVEGLIHFYNVLWIERRGDLAFRRAAGRVSKTAWEQNCSGPTEILLA
ncbi:hypothetical protein N0V90_008532 [Kalmusia sp. IMI 367209]|nr:hypothetical protein N0V90_008532 [Kalmusia sp. IMI 367209]